ncbi:hypothetical protein [Streptomyces sp. NPDC091416]|uniref:hypothetical protein n=1 Tax=Streptomyces sp. NPDC091416 TaxID=3366003 RepID=UPI003807EBC1
MTDEIPQGEGGENPLSYEERVRRLLRTPKAKAETARRGLDTDKIAENLIRAPRRHPRLDLDLDPQPSATH